MPTMPVFDLAAETIEKEVTVRADEVKTDISYQIQ